MSELFASNSRDSIHNRKKDETSTKWSKANTNYTVQITLMQIKTWNNDKWT